MTIIAAVHSERENTTYIASDTRTVLGGKANDSFGPKWIVGESGLWAVGHSGSMRTKSVLLNGRKELDDARESAEKAAYVIRQLLEKDGYKNEASDGPVCYGQYLIFATQLGVWHIDAAFCVVAPPKGEPEFSGSGHEIGVGAFSALRMVCKTSEMPWRDILDVCVRSAIENDIHCGGDVWVRQLGEKS